MRVDGPCELVDGKIVPLPLNGRVHSLALGRIMLSVTSYVTRKRLGIVVSGEAGFVVRRDPDSVRAPDLAFVSNATLARARNGKGAFFPGAPDLAIEVLSPDDTIEAMEAKVKQYLAAGAKAVWVASPAGRDVRVYEPRRALRVVERGGVLEGGAALPGFRAKVADFFQDLDD